MPVENMIDGVSCSETEWINHDFLRLYVCLFSFNWTFTFTNSSCNLRELKNLLISLWIEHKMSKGEHIKVCLLLLPPAVNPLSIDFYAANIHIRLTFACHLLPSRQLMHVWCLSCLLALVLCVHNWFDPCRRIHVCFLYWAVRFSLANSVNYLLLHSHLTAGHR